MDEEEIFAEMAKLRASILALLFCIGMASVHTQKIETCRQPIDLVFALDASGSVEVEGYNEIKKFTKELINGFHVGVDKTHVGVLTFSEIGEVQIGLTDTFDKNELLEKVDNLDYPGYRTATDDALRVANNEMFSISGGVRQGVPQVLILLTDGKCTLCQDSVETAVKPLKERGVNIYTIGVTDNINRTELQIIASEPSDDHMFEVGSFSELKSLIVNLQNKSCEVKKGKCAKPLPPFKCSNNQRDVCLGDQDCPGVKKCCSDGCVKNCTSPLLNCLTSIDVAFALDSSQSVGDKAYKEMKQFAIDIVDSFAVSQQEARFSSLIYSETAEIGFNFVRYDTAGEIKQAIKDLRHFKSSTRVDRALQLARSDLFSIQGKIRTRRPMVLIVFFDGSVSSHMKDLVEVAEPLKSYGVKVVAIGVGAEVNKYQMNKIASSESAIFDGETFNDIIPELYSIAKETCNEKPGKCIAEREPVVAETCVGVQHECANDFDCFGNAKCCKKGCKRICVQPEYVCKRKIDIAFAVHQNMKEEDFSRTKDFLRSSIDHFEVSDEKTHVALMTFGREAKVVFDFNTAQNWNDNMKQRVEGVKFEQGKGRISDVLGLSCDAIFCAVGGTRNDVPKMLVLITGPSSPSPSDEMSRRIATLRARGVDIIVIGTGDVDGDVLQALTSDDKGIEDRVWLTKTAAGMLQYGQDLADFACGEAGTSLPPTGQVGGPDAGGCKPKTCHKGPKGARGRLGVVGPAGEPGVRGLVGPKGLQGEKGIKGPNGMMGGKGVRGESGLIGLPGFPGYDGIPGVPGVAGRRGRDGDCGLPGQSGSAGEAGLAGFNGPPGHKGYRGDKGPKGKAVPFNPDLEVFPGEGGDPGVAGNNGIKGEKGADGNRGEEGSKGVDGDDGFFGERGEKGEPGIIKNIKGDRGERGPSGDPGPNYSTGGLKGEGPRGPPGSNGEKGNTGEDGLPGVDSTEKGAKGRPGARGDAGPKGLTGSSGDQGDKGPVGARGLKGLKGEIGDKGNPGQKGGAGDKGEVGPLGFDGADGNPGEDGASIPGKKGAPGGVGEKGLPGREGPIGDVGPEGPKGKQGGYNIGPAGDPGAVGPRGSRGENGMSGVPGMEGLAGEKGRKGEDGSRGLPGKNGIIIPGKPGMDGPPGPEGPVGPVGDTGGPGPQGEDVIVKCIESACPKGAKGVKGPPGNTGPPGDAGKDGLDGPKGYLGGPCPACPEGDQGRSGEIGKPGMPGKRGEQGFRGDVGELGPQGKRGPRGGAGDVGLTGPKGNDGPRGSIGEIGDDAPNIGEAKKGAKGSPGDPGKNGQRGRRGSSGEKGMKGSDGAAGKRGKEGAKGEVGGTGTPGRNGISGRSGAVGEPGESIRGPRGEIGDLGRQGDQGPTGEVGDPGPVGENGSPPTEEEMKEMKNKMAGDRGDKGDKGESGDAGSVGPEGSEGPRGPRGERGPRGPKGFGGVQGDLGEPGRAGQDGDPGLNGFPGLNGQTGAPGENGDPGPPGVTEKGDKGNKGPRGADGKRGEDAPPPSGCFRFGDPTDIGFVLDSSRSVTPSDFEKQKQFIKNILAQFPVGPEKTQAGIIKYSQKAEIELNFNEFETEKDLSNAVDGIKHDQADFSRLDLALEMASNNLFTQEHGARKDTAKALVILGDGHIVAETLAGKLINTSVSYAKTLRDSGVNVFAIGVGVEKNKEFLKELVSDPSYYLEIESYNELVNAIGNLQNSFEAGCITVGEPGKDGYDGARGDPGDNGAKGSRGISPQGEDGPKGIKGFNGEEGIGSRGIPGDDGLMGVPGPIGADGKNGADVLGEKGEKGIKGEKGDSLPGPRGQKGQPGNRGQPGPDASRIICDDALTTDIVFLIDTSSSVGSENFSKMKVFIDNIVQKFDVNNQLTRVSVVTYDTDARLNIKLSDHNQLTALTDAIRTLSYASGDATRIDKALILAHKEALTETNGARPGVRKALVLMTDGIQSYAKDQVSLKEAVKPLIEASVLRYAIGIGREIARTELSVVAGDNVVVADNFDELIRKIDLQIGLIGRGGCKGDQGLPGRSGRAGEDGFPGQTGPAGPQGPRGDSGKQGSKGVKGERGEMSGSGRKGVPGDDGDAGPRGLPGCTDDGNGQAVATDLGFMLDASASLTANGYKEEKEFIKSVIDKVGGISAKGIHVGVVVYSDEATLRIKFDAHDNTEDLKRAIDDLAYDRKQTRIDLGLEKAKEMFSVTGGGRGNSKKVLILLTDGQQTYVKNTRAPHLVAKELATEGIDIFSVGIGQEINRVELESFISKPEHIFLASDLSSLVADLSGDISRALKCEGGPRGAEGRPGVDGDPGSVGKVGSDGPQGTKGLPGEIGYGPRGDIGEIGGVGRQGELGEKGYRGPAGKIGNQGVRGPVGYDGPAGPKGKRGEIGFMGVEGPTGPPGAKGKMGNTEGDGRPGKRGPKGEVGPKGNVGDPASLPPGSEKKDYIGDKGPQGNTGKPGPVGEPGTLLVAPGELGVTGEPGPRGEPGDFGSHGPPGPQGPRGNKGKKGSKGITGDIGEDGSDGAKGDKGEVGDTGKDGTGMKGDKGEKGKRGRDGGPGLVGFLGSIGYIGMPGKKGEQGEAGDPGPQQTGGDPSRAPKGYPGEKGIDGDYGDQGEVGEPGVVIGPRGERGEKGLRGLQGDQGKKGKPGIPGPDGGVGMAGPRGRFGRDGDPGPQGPPGPAGPEGIQIRGSEKGDVGDVGDLGKTGIPGLRGRPGTKGTIGELGRRGVQGDRGKQGFPGLVGDQGKAGTQGPEGLQGNKGPQGDPGNPGTAGPFGVAEGNVIVTHSQNDVIPTCPRGYNKLWDGYSLVSTVGNLHSNGQDLGSTGSCVKSMSTLPFIFCDLTKCQYASRNDFIYWLATVSKPAGMKLISGKAIEPYISRCSVCEAPSTVIAVHSQDTTKPNCPFGWDALWDGYSFLMIAGAGNTGSGQSLSSSGSCLKEFIPKPFIECNGAGGSCFFHNDKFSFWLTTVKKDEQFKTQPEQLLYKSKNHTLESRVSRCKVCVRARRTDNGGNSNENTLLRRVARNIKSWFVN